MKRLLRSVALLWIASLHPAAAVGFQWASAPDPDRSPLRIAIWYPSKTQTGSPQIGPFEMNVAVNGAIDGTKHPLIVMSHGTGGMALNSYDTAMALAAAGFVVVAVTHTGDNYQDQSKSFSRLNFTDRPEQISRVLDYILDAWPARTAIDSNRIGMIGHSAGGTTTLVDAGGTGDFRRAVAFCQDNKDDWGCQRASQRAPIDPSASLDQPIAGKDPRIKAIVLAAPALAHIFRPNGLKAVTLPVQLWVSAEDTVVTDAPLVRTLLPAKPDYHLVPHAGHFAYLAPCSEILLKSAPEICADPKGFSRTAFLRGFHRSVIAFYRQHLK